MDSRINAILKFNITPRLLRSAEPSNNLQHIFLPERGQLLLIPFAYNDVGNVIVDLIEPGRATQVDDLVEFVQFSGSEAAEIYLKREANAYNDYLL